MKKLDIIAFASVLFYAFFFSFCFLFALSQPILIGFVIAALIIGAAGFYSFAKGD